MITPIRSAIATRTTIPFPLSVVRGVFAKQSPAEAMCASCPDLVSSVEQTDSLLHICFKPLGGALGLKPRECRLATKTMIWHGKVSYVLTSLEACPKQINPWDCVLEKVKISFEDAEEGRENGTEIRMKLSMYSDPTMPIPLRRLPGNITKKLAAGLKNYIITSVHGACGTARANIPSCDELCYSPADSGGSG